MDKSGLTAAEVQLVLRRAAELERRQGDGAALTAQELDDLAREVGLSPQAVAQALREMDAGALAPPESPGALERVLGPRQIVVERTLAGDAAGVQSRLERLLREQVLRKKRDFGARSLWEPSPGLVAQLRRTLDFSGTLVLGPTHELDVSVLDEGNGQTLVRLATDVGALQRKVVGGAVAGTALGVAAALVLSAFGVPHVLEWIAAAGATGVGSVSSVRMYRRNLGVTATALEHLIDRVQRGA